MSLVTELQVLQGSHVLGVTGGRAPRFFRVLIFWVSLVTELQVLQGSHILGVTGDRVPGFFKVLIF